MEHNVCELLDIALLTLHAELGRYDWVASTALAGAAAAAVGEDAAPAVAGGANWLHPQALQLTQHRPLAVFTNELVQMFNELRQCTLWALRAPVVAHCTECLMGAVNLLHSTRQTQGLAQGTPRGNEFAQLCRNFAEILVPL